MHRTVTRCLALIAVACLLLTASGAPAAVTQDDAPTTPEVAAKAPRPATVAIIPIHGEIDGVLASTFERRLKEALATDPGYVILDMDTWGGELHAAFEIAQLVRDIPQDVVTIAYVSKKAISAGALISFAGDKIAMRPSAQIGDCQAILSGGDGGIEVAPEKITTVLRNRFRDYASRNGWSADLAVAMVDPTNEVVRVTLAAEGADLSTDEGAETAREGAEVLYAQRKRIERWSRDKQDRIIEEVVIVEEGQLLTMTESEPEGGAVGLGFCSWVVDDRAELIEHLEAESGVTLTQTVYEQTGWESFVDFLSSGPMRAFFMFLGLLGVVVEFYHPGMLFPGIIGLISLCIAFFSGYLVGAVDVLDIGLIVVGGVLVMLEVFVIPGFGVAGILGGLFMLAGAFLSLQSFTLPETAWQMEAFKWNAEIFFVGIVGSAFLFMAILRVLPASPVFSRLVLSEEQRVENGYSVGSRDRVALIGQVGTAKTALRPAGKVEIGDDLIDAVSEGEFVEPGTRITVVATDGNRVVVVPDASRGEEANA